MKRLKLFFACLLMAVLSIGQVWAGETTYTMKTSGSGTAVEDNWTANTSASFNSSGAYWSCSATTNTFTITSGSGITGTITKVQVTGKRNKNKSYSIDVTVGGSALGSTFNGSGNANYDTEDTFSSSTGLTGTIVVSVSAAGGSNSSDKGSFWITSVTVTTEDGGGSSCSNTVAITKGAETNGTYTLSATEVCGDGDGEDVTISDITPAAGFEFDEITTSESGTVDNDLKKVTGITAATTITVKFKEKQKYTVSFNVGGSSASQTDIPETTAGAGIELPAGPTPTCTGWTFAGWKETSAVTEQTTIAPTLLAAGTNYKPAANCTLYAVYKQEAGSSTGTIDYTITFDDNSSDASSDISEEAFMNYITTNKSKVSSVSDIVKCYKGATGLKLSSKKNNGSFVLTLAESAAITKVVLNTKKKSTTQGASYGVMVGSEDFSTSSSLSKDDFVDVEFTGTKTTSNSLSIASLSSTSEGSDSDGRVAWLKSITVYYEGTVVTYNYLSTPTCTCTQLDAPTVSVPDGDLTYNSAKLTWGSVTDADKYKVYIYNADKTAEIEHNDAVEGTEYTIAATLTASTTYKYSVQAISDTPEDHCASDLTEGSFETKAAPAATLTLSEIGETHNFAGDHTVGEIVTLPLSATECSKTFVGWDPASNCTSAPTYAPGESYTLTATTQTLYAVYANPVGAVTYVKTALASIASGSEVVVTEAKTVEEVLTTWALTYNTTSKKTIASVITESENVLDVAGLTNGFWILTKDGDNFSLTAKGTTDKLYCTNTNDGVRVGEGEANTFSIKDSYIYTSATDDARYLGVYNATDFRCYTSINNNIKDQTLAFYKKNVNYEDYSTACAAPLASPTFSVDPADGPFDTEISVELDASEGTIYYTLNGTDPTNESTEYIDPIVLNTCGNKTIKAIAISSTNHSAVASATYEMTIPVPTNSQVAPYSPTEARDVIASGCYDGSTIMYVKGVVKSASAWNETYGNYDVVVRNIGNEDSETFTYYHMYAASENTKFTSDENIEVGDTILAAGVLTLYGSTYEFANNTCYMVEHKKITSKTSIDSDIDNPITVAAALGYIDQAATYDLTNVYVKGVASEDPNNQGTFNIHDADVDNTFQIFKGVLSQELIDAGVVVKENDTVIAVGDLSKFYSTYEMAQGGEIVVVKKYVAPTVAVTGVEVDATATVKAGKTVQLTATVLPDNASNKNVTWSVESGDAYAEVSATGLVTGKAEGTAVIRATSVADDTKYGECTVTVNPIAPANTDIITAEGIGVEGNSYVAWTGKTGFGTSSVYAGNSTNATNPNAGALQLRYNTASDKQSGIVLTESNGMVLKGLSVSVKSGSNTLNVYAKATAYSGYAELYSDDENVRGKLIGTVSATGAMTLEEGVSYDDNYQYIGMRSANGALYLDDITITWGAAYVPPTTYDVTYVSAHGTAPEAETAASVTLVELTEAGWTHTGWVADVNVEVESATVEAGTLIANGKEVVLSAATQFTAQWTENPAPTYTEVRNGLNEGEYYTMCLDKAVTAVKAGSIWRVLSKAANGNDVILEEVIGTLEAGRPYIFLAAASTLEVAYTGDAVDDPVNDDDNNGLIGSFSQVKIANVNTNYIIYNNALYYVNSNNVYVGEHRAYLDMTRVPNYAPQQGNNARRRVTMAVYGKDEAQGFDNLESGDAPKKVMIDGTLYIFRGEKQYDATGRLVK